MAQRRRLMLLALAALVVLAAGIWLVVTGGRPLYGTSCNTGDRCDTPSDGVRIVGSAHALAGARVGIARSHPALLVATHHASRHDRGSTAPGRGRR